VVLGGKLGVTFGKKVKLPDNAEVGFVEGGSNQIVYAREGASPVILTSKTPVPPNAVILKAITGPKQPDGTPQQITLKIDKDGDPQTKNDQSMMSFTLQKP
jgi:hypothetical protein